MATARGSLATIVRSLRRHRYSLLGLVILAKRPSTEKTRQRGRVEVAAGRTDRWRAHQQAGKPA